MSKYKYNWCIETGFAGATHRGGWEFDERPSDGELEEMLSAELVNYIDAEYWESEVED